MDEKKAFLSYSSDDKEFAAKLAGDLRREGVDVWFDTWEISAGDSLIQKIFFEGLANCDVFLILLSNNSVKSKWVKEELDSAVVRKIEGVTKIIPLIIDKCDIPISLRALKWVNLSEKYDEGIRGVIKSIYGVTEKPPTGIIPSYISDLKNSVGGLSRSASTLGIAILNNYSEGLGFEKGYDGKELGKLVSILSTDEINDAVEELEDYGLIKTRKYMGTSPYDFGYLEPTYALYLHFMNEGVDYNPKDDIKIIASTIAAKGNIEGPELNEISKLPPIRINRAISYLEDYGIIVLVKTLGTAPYNFQLARATRKTREFVGENCK